MNDFVVMFYIGTIFCVDVHGVSGQIIKPGFKSLYRIREIELAAKYSLIINALYENCFDQIILNHLNKFENGEDFEIAGVVFKSNGVVFKKTTKLIEWEDLGTRAYSGYYALYSKQHPNNYNTFEFVTDWNIGILYSATQQILKNKNFT